MKTIWNGMKCMFDFPKHDHDHDYYAAAHCIKWALIEDAYAVKQWQDCVKFGKLVTANESRLAGWYHSPCTIGPDPKPIRTGGNTPFSCYNAREATVL